MDFYKLLVTQQRARMDAEKGRCMKVKDRMEFEERKRQVQDLIDQDYETLTPMEVNRSQKMTKKREGENDQKRRILF